MVVQESLRNWGRRSRYTWKPCRFLDSTVSFVYVTSPASVDGNTELLRLTQVVLGRTDQFVEFLDFSSPDVTLENRNASNRRESPTAAAST